MHWLKHELIAKTMFNFVRKYRKMILISLIFFYLGCGLTISFLRIECDATALTLTNKSSEYSEVEYPVLVLTSPDNEGKRNAIRATWGNFASNIFIENGEKLYKWNHTWLENSIKHGCIKVFFVIGTKGLNEEKAKKLHLENSRTKDLILLDDFVDAYKNLASKMVHSIKWFSKHLPQLKYLTKCDDDSFVRIDLIVKNLEAFAPEMNAVEIRDYISYKSNLPSYKGLYWGYFDGRAKVNLNKKWQEKDWFLCDNYLPYALGGGYVISKSIVDFIARNAEFLSLYNSEDVSMGVWTSVLDGVNRVHDLRFDTEWKSRGCNKNMLVRHKQTPNDMFNMYRTLVASQGEQLCKTESTERKSYLYKWNLMPSMCCR